MIDSRGYFLLSGPQSLHLRFPVVFLGHAYEHSKNGAHYKDCKPLGYPFTITFSGSLPLLIQDPSFPEVSSPPLEEDMTDLPTTPTLLNLINGPCLVAYPLGTPEWD
ncbi:hypothetical protein DSO57_1008633 [Entomophthora muscae]|uniref:Uncharacterized protein n=1 Tax=Entomophthora muscae TaxID=34485 RepID=A0ACC2TTZ4_9FUNG|nr:hypothetical protein DSO57_1008633 [Entomophthora muscae]